MIVSPDWIWLHLPKCAGTTTDAILFAAFEDAPGVTFDAMDPTQGVIWHQTIAARAARRPGFGADGRRVLANIRRLPHWLLSRVFFEVQRRGEAALPRRADLLRGVFLQPARGPRGPVMKPVSADAMLRPYAAEVTEWLRCEHLRADLSRAFGLPPDHPALAARDENETATAYPRDLGFWFTPSELQALYARNPLWAGIERQVYGGLLTL